MRRGRTGAPVAGDGRARACSASIFPRRCWPRRARTRSDPAIEFRRGDLEQLDTAGEGFDLAVSSLAFHYLPDFGALCRRVAVALEPGGAFVFSVEHPMTTARAEQAWHTDRDGRRLHWPVDNYNDEGARQTNWLGSPVVKYHRTIASYVNALLAAGLELEHLAEPVPDAAFLAANPHLANEARRPPFLLVKAIKPKARRALASC